MLSLIVALDENNLIGSENSMPWDVPEERKSVVKGKSALAVASP